MSKDKLEQFIIENESEFNDANPPSHLWQKIENDLDKGEKKIIPWRKNLLVAASAVILLGVGVWFGSFWTNNQNNRYDELMALSEYQEYKETEQYYIQRVGSTWQEIKQFGDYPDIKEDLQQLDEVYQELKEELENTQNGNTELIIQAMLNKQKNKLKILEKVRTRISKNPLNNNKTSNNEDLKI